MVGLNALLLTTAPKGKERPFPVPTLAWWRQRGRVITTLLRGSYARKISASPVVVGRGRAGFSLVTPVSC
jgi:hypothetical protein